jgi:UDP-N-acetylglucosamine transferase subunit ALG13
MRVFVTVGMGRWPFDRLLLALQPLCSEHDLLVQSGTSTVKLDCVSIPFLSWERVQEEITNADAVITHAGNTVRLVQRAGKIPIAIARTARLKEMGNDHQVKYLRHDEQHGRVLAVWDVRDLQAVVRNYNAEAQRIRASRPAPSVADGGAVRTILDELCRKWIR